MTNKPNNNIEGIVEKTPKQIKYDVEVLLEENHPTTQADAIRDYITRTLQTHTTNLRTKLLERVEESWRTYEGATMYAGASKRIRVDGYNEALKDIETIINDTLPSK